MIANLKAKAEGFDKKRIYTAVAALVIAGAAGHTMQRGASGGADPQALPASIPGKPQAAAPAVAAAMMGMTPAAPARVPEATPVVQAEADPAPDAAPKVQPPELVVGAEAQADPDPLPFAASETVTRSEAEPILAVTPVEPDASDVELALADADEEPLDTTQDLDPIILASAVTITDTEQEPATAVATCEIGFDAQAETGARVALSISAPCNSGENIEFYHAGLRFSEQLGPEGNLFVTIPAMTEIAVVSAEFTTGLQKVAEVTLPDFASYQRVALVWKGATGLQLHALEHGAGYGEPGHVWAETPASVEAALAGEGGFVSVLGSMGNGYAADVYTYPVSLMNKGDEPRVSIEAQVMENTCGNTIEGAILRSNAGRAPTQQSLEMAIPGCVAVGEYLVLNNLPQDLKLARN